MLVFPGFEGLVTFQFMLLLSVRTFDQNLVNLFLNLYERALRNQFRFFSDGIIFASTVILAGLAEVWQRLQTEKPGIEARKMLFPACCRLGGIQEPDTVWARLTGSNPAEKDLALELLETARGTASLLKSLAAVQG